MNLLCVSALLPIEIDLRAALEYPPSAASRHLPPQGKENKKGLMRVAVAVMMIVVVIMIVGLSDLALGIADHERVDHAA